MDSSGNSPFAKSVLALKIPRDSIRCERCSNVLGEAIDSLFILQHRGRTTIGPKPMMIKCEDCEAVWVNPEFRPHLGLGKVIAWLRSVVPIGQGGAESAQTVNA